MRPSPPSRRHQRLLLIGLLAVSGLILVACSEHSVTNSGASGEQAAAAEPQDDAPTGPPDQGPDPLPDPGVAPGECKLVTYTPPSAEDAYKGELCRPASDQRDVAVTVVHGGSGIGGSYTGMRPWATRLLAEGYVVFLPSYHLFRPGGESPVFPVPEQNIKAATQFLRGTANALGTRRDRVVVQGMSAGARVGAVAYSHPDDNYFAGDELWPDISDEVNGFIGFYHPYDGSMQYSDQYYGGSDDSTDKRVQARWDHADSLAGAGNAVGPALFITGGEDWDLIVDQQNEFAGVLKRNDVAARTVVVKGGGHGFDIGNTTRLSRLGEQAASEVLRWLNTQFPQTPRRASESVTADLATAPDYTGAPPTSVESRRRTTPTVTSPGSRSATTVAPKSSTTSTSTTAPPASSSSTTTTVDTSTSSSSSTTSTTQATTDAGP